MAEDFVYHHIELSFQNFVNRPTLYTYICIYIYIWMTQPWHDSAPSRASLQNPIVGAST